MDIFNAPENLVAIGIAAIIIISIYFIIRGIHLGDYFKKIKEKKALRFTFYIIILLLVIGVICLIILGVKGIMDKMQIKIGAADAESKIAEENNFYEKQMQKTYNTNSYKTPYIPDGYKHVEGEYNTGFVIEDETGNQYVWIPCSNTDTQDSAILRKSNFGDDTLFDYKECYDKTYKDFIISTLENGGFYISRYEIGKEGEVPVSKPNVPVWNNTTFNQAESIVASINNKSDNNICIEVINGFGWDTAYEWVTNNNNDIQTTYFENDEKENIITGRNAYNNIYDLTDNIIEVTQERNNDRVIYKGKINANEENEEYFREYRYTAFDEDSILTFDSKYTAIRTVLYKK